MKRAAAGLLVLALAACGPSDPLVLAEQRTGACATSAFENQRMLACSAIIADPASSPEQRVQAFINRGVERARLGEHGRAVADFGRALRIDPQNANAYLQRGIVHQDRGAFDSAVASYDSALDLDPGLDIAWQRREEAMGYTVEPWRGELNMLNQALLRDPNNVELLNNRCWTRAVNGDDLDLALADCNAALAREPRYSAVLDSRGLVYLKRGDYARALADYEAALAIEPNNGHYLYGRGLTHRAMGRKDLADADMRQAETMEPGIGVQYATYNLSL
ncbi:tetratricopeptide repeat protein [Vitreimonas flagellata]|uniref:tetratricopeptide repeat protein n=1 Tax=Vitreimonas flagellata TaxID=2560861 RepID=UPI0010755FA7|nr:tetratricopeptide repeat protein [Vitreimonas flagellata]